MAENAPEQKPEGSQEAAAAAGEQKAENAPNLVKDDVTGEMVSKK